MSYPSINEKIFYGGLSIVLLGGLTSGFLILVGIGVAAIGAVFHDYNLRGKKK